jgi:hypothetical protein
MKLSLLIFAVWQALDAAQTVVPAGSDANFIGQNDRPRLRASSHQLGDLPDNFMLLGI